MPPPTNLLQSPDTIDPYMGFSHSLLLLINQIAGLAWKPADEIKSMRATDVLPLRRRLEGLEQVLPSQCEDPDTECAAIAEANRLGALLLLHEICSNKSITAINSAYCHSAESEEKSQYVKLILNLILEKKGNMMRTAVLPLWPLFLAGCCAFEEEGRVKVMQLFEELEGIHRFGVSDVNIISRRTTSTDSSRTLHRPWRSLKWFGDRKTCLYRTKGSAKNLDPLK